MVLLISYDLNRHERPNSYTRVKDMIEKTATSSIRVLYSQWFVHTGETPRAWHARMEQVTDTDDRWFICVVARDKQAGWVDDEVGAWMRKHL